MNPDFNVYRLALKKQAESWFLLNDHTRANLVSVDRLITVEHATLIIDTFGFKEAYQYKFIKGKIDKYGPALIEFLTPHITHFIKLVGYSNYSITVIVKQGADEFKKEVYVRFVDCFPYVQS